MNYEAIRLYRLDETYEVADTSHGFISGEKYYTLANDEYTITTDSTPAAGTIYYIQVVKKRVGINWDPRDNLPQHELSVNGALSVSNIRFFRSDKIEGGSLSYYEDNGVFTRLIIKVGSDFYNIPSANVGTPNFYNVWTTKDLSNPFDINGINNILPITNGGTGAATVAAARNNLGLGNTSGALPIANGGTGAITEFNAVANLLWKEANDATYLTGDTATINNAGTFIGWYDSSSTISIKPSTYGYLLSIGGRGGVNWHQIWMTQNNGALYHRGGNNNSTSSSVSFKQIIDETGGTLTGQLTTTINNGFLLTTGSGSAMMRATRSDTGASVGFGVGSGGTNHGVYSYLLNDWLIYASDTETIVKGRCTGTAANVTGTVAVGNGGTGATTFTSGNALIGAGTGAITTRAITNMTSVGGITYNTNLMTTNTLAYWNGRYGSGSGSNLTYYTGGTIYGSGQFGWKRQSMNLSSGAASTSCTGVIATSVIAAQRVGTYSDTSGNYSLIGASASNAGNIKVFTATGSSGGSWTVSLFWTKVASGG